MKNISHERKKELLEKAKDAHSQIRLSHRQYSANLTDAEIDTAEPYKSAGAVIESLNGCHGAFSELFKTLNGVESLVRKLKVPSLDVKKPPDMVQFEANGNPVLFKARGDFNEVNELKSELILKVEEADALRKESEFQRARANWLATENNALCSRLEEKEAQMKVQKEQSQVLVENLQNSLNSLLPPKEPVENRDGCDILQRQN